MLDEATRRRGLDDSLERLREAVRARLRRRAIAAAPAEHPVSDWPRGEVGHIRRRLDEQADWNQAHAAKLDQLAEEHRKDRRLRAATWVVGWLQRRLRGGD